MDFEINYMYKQTAKVYCPEEAFCVGRLIKYPVRASDRVRPRPSLATNQQILGKNLEIRGFSVTLI